MAIQTRVDSVRCDEKALSTLHLWCHSSYDKESFNCLAGCESLFQKFLRVLLALAVVINVATAGAFLAPYNETHSEHHEKVVPQATSLQDHHDSHCVLDVANTSSSHCGVSIYALIDSSRALFYASTDSYTQVAP